VERHPTSGGEGNTAGADESAGTGGDGGAVGGAGGSTGGGNSGGEAAGAGSGRKPGVLPPGRSCVYLHGVPVDARDRLLDGVNLKTKFEAGCELALGRRVALPMMLRTGSWSSQPRREARSVLREPSPVELDGVAADLDVGSLFQ